MQNDTETTPPDAALPDTEEAEASPAANARAEAYRERFRKAQLIAAQVARARAAGGTPSDGEAANLVAEFHAQGGRVTVCPPVEPVESSGNERTGSGKRQGR